MDWSYYDLIILIKALLCLRNQCFCIKNSNSTTINFNIFCWNFARVSFLPLSTKECSGFFLFCLDLELFAKIKKSLVSTHLFFHIFVNNPRSKQNKKKKSWTRFCRHCQVGNLCKMSVKIIELYGSSSLW